jgi:hypothetical protein
MALYSKLGSNLATDSPQKLSSLLSLFSSLGRRPCVSWLVETPNPGSTPLIAHNAPLARSLKGNSSIAPGCRASGYPGFPLSFNAARPTALAGSTRCATG